MLICEAAVQPRIARPDARCRMQKNHSLLKKSLLAAALSAVLSTAPRAEQAVYDITYGDQTIFELHFYGEGETAYTGTLQQDYGYSDEEMCVFISSSDFSAQAITASVQAAKLWAEVLSGSFAASSPVEVSLSTLEWQNAAAYSASNKNPDGSFATHTTVADKLLFDTQMRIPGIIAVGEMGFELQSHPFTLPQTTGVNFTAAIAHEFGHLLGIYTDIEFEGQTDFSARLYDCFGRQYAPDLDFFTYDDSKEPVDRDGVFNVGYRCQSGVYFIGEHVSEVLAGSGMPGVPVQGWEYSYYEDPDNPGEWLTETYSDLSHLELERSMMSHQFYRSYTFFIEAELAVLQDIGYKIDRRNFYGYSVYGDGQEIINEHPFFARNDSGTAYLQGVPNTATLGTGLHVYGKHNSIVQAAPLLACGTAGVGIRVDGTDNRLVIPENIEIHADGSYGTGVLFAYGMEHELQVDGTVTALGTDGVALRFDFGQNLLSQDVSSDGYRGSYIWQNYYNLPIFNADGSTDNFDPESGFELNLHGPLAETVTIGGSIAGSEAAIYISENALVGEINFINGSEVVGDIISHWDPYNPLIDSYVQEHREDFDLYTELNFGVAADSASASPAVRKARSGGTTSGLKGDADFSMTLVGSIKGYNSLKTKVLGGSLTLTGYVEAYSLENHGSLAVLGQDEDGWDINLKQDLTLAEASALILAFDHESSGFNVKASDIELGGVLCLAALPDYYQNNQSIEVKVNFDGDVNGGFDELEVLGLDAPVLDFDITAPESWQNGVFTITPTRETDAYAQFADDRTSSETGFALYQLAGSGNQAYRDLFTALDFSDADTIGRALHTLSAEAYDGAMFASLRDKLNLSRRVFDGQLNRRDFRQSGSYVYAGLFGSELNTERSDFKLESEAAGIILGADFKLSRALTLGVDLLLSSLDTDIKGSHNAQYEETAALAGINLLYRPEAEGFYLTSSVHAGMLQGKMKRSLNAGTFHSKVDADWNAFTGTAQLGGGYNFNFESGDSAIDVGPYVLLQYAGEHRPDLSESGSAGLDLESDWFDSMPVSAGLSLTARTVAPKDTKVSVSLKGGYYHELLDTSDSSTASFSGSSYSFSTSTKRPDSKGLTGDLALSAEFPGGFSAALNVSAQGFLDDAHSVSAGINLAYSF